MSGAKHTPGPWGFFQDDDYGEEFTVDVPRERRPKDSTTPYLYLPIAGVSLGERGEEAKANARLIAAAPDLLEAVEAAKSALAALGRVQMYGSADMVRDRAARALSLIEDAIKKARGES